MNTLSKENHKIVVLGSCSVDFTTYAPRLPLPGETLKGTKFTTSFGGKGANQCVAAAKLGGNTYMVCRVGDDHWGVKYIDNFKNNGVDITHVNITPNVTTGVAQICVADNGENQIIIVPGANGHLSTDDILHSEELLKNADIIIGQLETPFETTLKAFKLSNGIKILNAAPARCDINEILPYCNILCVNESEASQLTNLQVDILNVSLAVSKLLLTGCDTVIITLGEQGAVYSSKTDKDIFHVLCEKVTAVDTTGAGDAFIGALATFLITHKNFPLHQIIAAACAVATVSVTQEGTQTSFPSKYNAFSKEYQFNIL